MAKSRESGAEKIKREEIKRNGWGTARLLLTASNICENENENPTQSESQSVH